MNGGFFVFITGLLMTLLGVGGIENSITDSELLSGVAVSAVGLLIMWAGTLLLKSRERAVDNPTLW